MTVTIPEALRRNLAPIGALAVLTCALLFDLFVPMPKPPMTPAERLEAQRSAETGLAAARRNLASEQVEVKAGLFDLTEEQLGPAVLRLATEAAKAEKLQVRAFRPRRSVEVEGLKQSWFMMSVEGPFPAVLSLVRRLEDKGTKLAVNMVQMSSADGHSDRVNATIGVVALVEGPKKESNGQS